MIGMQYCRDAVRGRSAPIPYDERSRRRNPCVAGPAARSAFTIIELLIVMAVMAMIAGGSFIVLTAVRAKANRQATRSLLGAIAVAIADYRHPVLRCTDGFERPIWDLDGDGILDGDPQAEDAPPLLKTRAPAGFRGLVEVAALDLPRHQLDARSQVVDAWKRPLRIAFAARIYGRSPYGIRSLGKDGIDGTDDDLHSWRTGDE